MSLADGVATLTLDNGRKRIGAWFIHRSSAPLTTLNGFDAAAANTDAGTSKGVNMTERFIVYGKDDPFYPRGWQSGKKAGHVRIYTSKDGTPKMKQPEKAWIHEQAPYLAVTRMSNAGSYSVTYIPNGYSAGSRFDCASLRQAKRACIALSRAIDWEGYQRSGEFTPADNEAARAAANAVDNDSPCVSDYIKGRE